MDVLTCIGGSSWSCTCMKHAGVTESRGLAACHSKANKEPVLVERKVCFILDAGNWGEGRTPVQRPTPPH